LLALGLGVPVIGAAVDGLADTLGQGRAVLVPPDAPHALARALSRVLGGERPVRSGGRSFGWVAPGIVSRRRTRATGGDHV
jgi:glycosyltransferase involved in cell wall biosynthesis